MNYQRAPKPVHLPHVPLIQKTSSVQDEFWLKKGESGAINAVRQLASNIRKGGRKVTLPGGKLKPLFKNYATNQGDIKHGNILPSIRGLGSEGGLKHILSGNLEDLPELSPATVRVYLASNYDDMKLERSVLLRKAVPELQEFCSELGLHFQLVDLHMGVPPNFHNETSTIWNHLSHEEIKCCQRLSIGPQFVLLLGDRYGTMPLPEKLTEAAYTMLMNTIPETAQENMELLKAAYFKDENAIPAAYVLKAQQENVGKVQAVFKDAMNLAKVSGSITDEEFRRMTMSDLERDIKHGILDQRDPRKHCLCYHREFLEILSHLSSDNVSCYIDTVADVDGNITIDQELNERSQHLSKSMMEHLGVANCKNYYLTWTGSNLDENTEYAAYLDDLCDDFIKNMKEMIISGYKQVSGAVDIRRNEVTVIEREVLYHMGEWQAVMEDYTREPDCELFLRLEKFLRDPVQNKKPFVIHGPSGCGKTTTTAAIVKQLKTWFSEDCVVALRFCGKTWHSSNIKKTVMSITQQISLVYNLKLPVINEAFSTLHQTLVTFRAVLDTVSREFAFSHPLFIVLDGIDQLHPYQDCLKALWAMKHLPPNVHMIVSTTVQIGPVNLLNALTQMVTSENATAQVPPLTSEEIKLFATSFLEKAHRKLTDVQITQITDAVGQNPQPLFIKHMILKASSYPADLELGDDLPPDVEEIINRYFDELESDIGEAIVEFFVSYITASNVGLPECELIDLLSANTDVMDEVYSRYVQPEDNIVLFPSSLLSRIKFTLRNFLDEHLLLGIVVLSWNHKEIWEAAGRRYNVVYPGISEGDITEDATNFSLMLHEHFINLLLPGHKTELMSESSSNEQSSGLVPFPQPIKDTNALLIHRLVTHMSVLIPVEGLTRVKKAIFFNFNWLLTKIKCAPLHSLFDDILSTMQLAKHLEQEGVLEEDSHWEEFDVLLHFLELAEAALIHSPESLAVEVKRQLPPLVSTFPSLQDLVTEAEQYIMNNTKTQLVPLYPCFDNPSEPKRHVLAGSSHVLGLTPSKRSVITFSQKNGVGIWNLDSGRLEQRFSVNLEQAVDCVIPAHDTQFVVIGHYSHLNHVMEVESWNITTGLCLAKLVRNEKFDAMALSHDDQTLYMATTVADPINREITQKRIILISLSGDQVTMSCEEAHFDVIHKMIPIQGVRKSPYALLTLGGLQSKDLAYWDLDSRKMDYMLSLGTYPDLFEVNIEASLAVGGNRDDGVLTVVDLREGLIKATSEDKIFKEMQHLYISQSGEFVLIATHLNGIVVYSVTKNSPIKTIATWINKSDENTSCNMIPAKITMDDTEHLLFIGFNTGNIIIYSIITGERLTALDFHSGAISSLQVIPDDMLLSAGEDHQAVVWNYAESVLEHLSNNVMSGDEQFQVEIVKEERNEPAETPMFPSSIKNTSCMVMGKSEMLFTGSLDGPIHVWDAETGEHRTEYRDGIHSGVAELYLAYKGNLLVGHCVDPQFPHTRLLQVWKAENGQPITFDETTAVCVYTSCVFPSDDRLLTISPNLSSSQRGIIVGIYDLFEMKCVASLHCNIYGDMDCSNLRLLGFTTAPPEGQGDMEVESLSGRRSHDDKESTTVSLLDQVPRQYAVLDYFPSEVMSFFFTFVIYGKELLDISMDHHEPIHLDTASPKCTLVLPKCLCVSGSTEGSLILWNAATQTILTDFCEKSLRTHKDRQSKVQSPVMNHHGPVACMALAPDNIHVISGGTDGKVKLWNLNSKILVTTFHRHTQEILDVTYKSPELITVTSNDKTLSVWNVAEQKFVCDFYAHSHLSEVVMTADMSRLIAYVSKPKPSVIMLKLVSAKTGDL